MIDDLVKRAAAVRELSPPDQLRLAAELLEHQRAELAYSILERVKMELEYALAIARRGSNA